MPELGMMTKLTREEEVRQTFMLETQRPRTIFQFLLVITAIMFPILFAAMKTDDSCPLNFYPT